MAIRSYQIEVIGSPPKLNEVPAKSMADSDLGTHLIPQAGSFCKIIGE
jgi:hypothetical protein